MKPWKLLLFSLVPTAAGWFRGRLMTWNVLRPIPLELPYWLISWAVAAFCLWLGLRCGRRGPSFPRALALTQWPSVVGLGLYVWQFHFVEDAARSSFWALLGQLSPQPMLSIAFSLLRPFAGRHWGPPETLLANILSLLLLAALFSAGYWWGHTRTEHPE